MKQPGDYDALMDFIVDWVQGEAELPTVAVTAGHTENFTDGYLVWENDSLWGKGMPYPTAFPSRIDGDRVVFDDTQPTDKQYVQPPMTDEG